MCACAWIADSRNDQNRLWIDIKKTKTKTTWTERYFAAKIFCDDIYLTFIIRMKENIVIENGQIQNKEKLLGLFYQPNLTTEVGEMLRIAAEGINSQYRKSICSFEDEDQSTE